MANVTCSNSQWAPRSEVWTVDLVNAMAGAQRWNGKDSDEPMTLTNKKREKTKLQLASSRLPARSVSTLSSVRVKVVVLLSHQRAHQPTSTNGGGCTPRSQKDR
uniref:Uncharacterized protein n=1 Tax=Oryza glumipatula TaxID=40148 RepID=A0A0E0BGZ5_9ORYZ